MAQAPASTQQRPRRVRPSLWRRPFTVGLCLALGYGITQRLLDLGLPSLVQLNQGFEVRPFPGISLEGLRQRFSAEPAPLRADLERIRLEQEPRQAERQRQEQRLNDGKLNGSPPEAALPPERQLGSPPQQLAPSRETAQPPPPPDLPPPPTSP